MALMSKTKKQKNGEDAVKGVVLQLRELAEEAVDVEPGVIKKIQRRSSDAAGYFDLPRAKHKKAS